MKRLIITLLAAVLFTGSALASAEMVKEKAKQQRDLNNQRQGITPAPTTPVPSSGAAAPPQQGMSTAQQALLERVQIDFTNLKPGSAASADQKQHLEEDLALLGKGTTKPSKQALTKLAADLAAAFAEKTIPVKDASQLTKDINIVANCSILTIIQSQAFAAEVQTILKRNGISEPVTQAVGTDLKAIVTEIQSAKPKLYQ